MSEETESQRFKSLKTFVFKILMTFQEHKFTNPLLFLILDILELCTLHYFYVNPTYPHIKSLNYPSAYFSTVYPYFYFFKTDSQPEMLPNIMTVSIYPFFLVLFIIGVQTDLIFIIYLCEIVFLLYPFIILRLSAELVLLFEMDLQWKIGGAVLAIITISIGVVFLIQYRKIFKFTDFFVTLLICLKINTFVIFSFLAVKLAATGKFGPQIYAKNIKLWFQISLLVSCLTIYFIPETSMNYFMLLCFIGVTTLGQIPAIYETVFIKELHQTQIVEEAEDTDEELFSMNQINYMRKIQEHRSICMLLECDCESFSKVTTVKGMNKWARNFYKQELKIKENFESKIEYAESCFWTEVTDFSGLFYLFMKKHSNVREEYLEYKILKRYENSLKERNNKTIGHIKGKTSELRENIIDFETKLIDILTNIRQFWVSLLDAENLRECEKLARAISEKIETAVQDYEELSETYDEILQIQFYFSLFRKIILHQHVSDLKEKELEEALMVSRDEVILQISQKACELFCRQTNEMIGCSFQKLMPNMYASSHSSWVKKWIMNFSPKSEEQKPKIILIQERIIKILMIRNIMIPRFSQGILILSKFSQPNKLMKNECYFLLDQNSLEIVGYERSFFQMLNVKVTEDFLSQLKQKNIFEFFPNINKESLAKSKSTAIQVKLNSAFLQDIIISCNSEKHIGKKILKSQSMKLKEQVTFYYWKVDLPKTQQLNLVLLAFAKTEGKDKKKGRNSYFSRSQQKQEEGTNQEEGNSLQWVVVVFLALLTLLILGFHLLFQIQIQHIEKELQFQQKSTIYFYDFVETCLFHLQIPIGNDAHENLEKLWIEGYDESSEVFNIFQQLAFDSFFDDQFEPMLIIDKQNSLYKNFENQLSKNKDFLEVSIIVLTTIFWLGIILALLNFFLTTIAIILVQKKVKEIVSQFSILQDKEVKNILDQFLQDASILLGRQQVEKEMEEIFQGISLREFDRECDSYLQLNESNKKVRFAPPITNSQVSIKNSKKNLTSLLYKSGKKIKMKKKKLFEKTNSVGKIINENISFFVSPFLGNLAFIFTILIFTVFLNIFFTSSKVCFKVSARLSYEPILFNQNFQEEYLHISLDPDYSLSQYNFQTQEILKELPEEFSELKEIFHKVNTQNICDFVTESDLFQKCANKTDIYGFGFQVIYQYLQEHFRETSNLTIDSSMEDLVLISKDVFKKRFYVYKEGQEQYLKNVRQLRLWGYPFGAIFTIFGIVMQCKSLYFLRNRVKKTKNLFVFIPQKYRKKLEKEENGENEEENQSV